MKLSVIITLGIFIFTFGVNQAFAVEIKYEPNGVMVRNNPIVCSIQPIDTDLTKNELRKFDTQTKSSIDEWESHLKNKTEKSNWTNWEIDHKHFNYDKLDPNSISECGIVVMFSNTPPNLSF